MLLRQERELLMISDLLGDNYSCGAIAKLLDAIDCVPAMDSSDEGDFKLEKVAEPSSIVPLVLMLLG